VSEHTGLGNDETSEDGRISLGNILTIIGMLVAGFWFFANGEKKDALQDAQIEANKSTLKELIAAEQQARKEGFIAEQQARKEAVQELRLRVDADRAEMRQLFDKLEAKLGHMDSKIDALIKQGQ